jgi:hypothetical protein
MIKMREEVKEKYERLMKKAMQKNWQQECYWNK